MILGNQGKSRKIKENQGNPPYITLKLLKW